MAHITAKDRQSQNKEVEISKSQNEVTAVKG